MEEALSRDRARSMALGVFLQITPLYIIAIGIWGPALGKSWLWFILAGLLVGIAIGLFNALIIANQQSTERANELMSGMGSLVGGVGTIIGILGLLVLIVRLLFFR